MSRARSILARSRAPDEALGAPNLTATMWGWGSDAAESRRIFDAYLDRGGNFIDTATVAAACA